MHPLAYENMRHVAPAPRRLNPLLWAVSPGLHGLLGSGEARCGVSNGSGIYDLLDVDTRAILVSERQHFERWVYLWVAGKDR